MEGFTLGLALVDAIPVLAFGASMVLIAVRFNSPLFILGAVLSTLAGCCKVAWKLILGIWKKNVQWLNKPFVPMQATGFGLMLISFLLGFKTIRWPAVWASVTGLPAALFFLAWLVGMGAMGWYRKTRFDNSPRANWIAQGINCAAQGALLLGILFSVIGA